MPTGRLTASRVPTGETRIAEPAKSQSAVLLRVGRRDDEELRVQRPRLLHVVGELVNEAVADRPGADLRPWAERGAVAHNSPRMFDAHRPGACGGRRLPYHADVSRARSPATTS